MKKPKMNSKSPDKDRCQTPPYAMTPLYPYISTDKVILEPAAGQGLMAATLTSHGYKVITGDIETGQDFFKHTYTNWDVLVTNPPYSIKYKWLDRCIELGKPFALLMPGETIYAQKYAKHALKFGFEVLAPSARINFKMPNMGWGGRGSTFPTAWFTYGLGVGTPFKYVTIYPVNMKDFGVA